jgi:VWFA-related protein
MRRIHNFMRTVWISSAALLLAIGVGVGIAQEPTFKTGVDIVNLLFSVREKHGGLVGNLQKEDFTVYEDGTAQTIKYFARDTDLPLTIGLLVDVSGSQRNLIEIERNAASQFFSKVLRPKDMAFLISFGPDADLLQDYTNSAKLLRKGLDDLRVSSDVRGITPGPVPTASHPRGTVLFDAVYLGATEKLRTEVGRKALVLITDGVDQGSRYDIKQAIEAAQRADAIIYSIDYSDPSAYGGYGRFGGFGGPNGEGDLRRMSDETGGHLFKVDRKNTLDDIFNQLNQEMRSQYAIGYTPTNSAKDNTFRRVEVKVTGKDLKVQARKGYYASPSQ